MKFCIPTLITVLGLFVVAMIVMPTKAKAVVTIEQQINIINQEYSLTASGSAAPADNSLGFIQWEPAKFNNEAVYFEAHIKCVNCNGGNSRITAGLYNSSGILVTNSTISTTTSSYTLIRSPEITSNLSENSNYTVKITLDADSGTATINQAKLIIIQSAEEITNTQSQIEIGNYTSINNTDYVIMPAPKIIRYDDYYYNPEPIAYFEATLKSADPTGIAYARLSSSSDCNSIATNSQISSTGTSWNRVRSSAITLNPGTSYFVCLTTSNGAYPASISNAKLILEQSNGSGIESSMIYHSIVNSLYTTTLTSYSSTPYELNFKPNNFSGKYFNYYYEATIKTAQDVVYSRLYDSGNNAALNSSQIDHNSNSYARKRSSELSMPTQDSSIITEIRNSSVNPASISSSTLIIYMFSEPELTFIIENVPTHTETNGITTSDATQFNRLDFSSLIPQTPKYLAHKLTVSTNAAGGYSVYMKMQNTLQGNYPANFIEEFPSSWATPQAWYEPTGGTPNINTGWIGANTSDTRISGWENGSGLFGPVNTTSHVVMQSDSADPGTSVYVTYAIEINQRQPTDLYAGTLIYNIVPTY